MGTDQCLAAQTYVALTTFRPDSSPVTTPVWVAALGDRLVVWTPAKSAKVDRLRHDRRIEIAPSNFDGSEVGPSRTGTAELLPRAEWPQARRTMLAKYGWKFREFYGLLRLVQTLRLNKIIRTGRIARAAGGPVPVEITLAEATIKGSHG